MSNSLDSDQARHYAGRDLGASCFQVISSNTRSQWSVRHTTHMLIITTLLGQYRIDHSKESLQRRKWINLIKLVSHAKDKEDEHLTNISLNQDGYLVFTDPKPDNV